MCHTCQAVDPEDAGTADGLTTHLHRRFLAARYLGIELEVNQRLPLGDAEGWRRAVADLTQAVAEAARWDRFEMTIDTDPLSEQERRHLLRAFPSRPSARSPRP